MACSPTRPYRGIALTLLILAGLGAVAWSAPMLAPPKRALSDEIRTLANINMVNLVITPLPARIIHVGYTEELIYKNWVDALKKKGVAVVNHDGVPKLRLTVATTVDESAPNTTCFLNFLTVEHATFVDRLDTKFVIPTWTGLKLGLTHDKHLGDRFAETLKASIDHFLLRVSEATAKPK